MLLLMCLHSWAIICDVPPANRLDVAGILSDVLTLATLACRRTNQVDRLVIGGGMVFTFLKARGLSVGSSLVEDDKLDLVSEEAQQRTKADGRTEGARVAQQSVCIAPRARRREVACRSSTVGVKHATHSSGARRPMFCPFSATSDRAGPHEAKICDGADRAQPADVHACCLLFRCLLFRCRRYGARGDRLGVRALQARELEKTAASKGVEIILPTDVVVADAFSADANSQVPKPMWYTYHTHQNCWCRMCRLCFVVFFLSLSL